MGKVYIDKSALVAEINRVLNSYDPQPEYAKVVNYPYSKLIGYNGIRSIDIIKPIIKA